MAIKIQNRSTQASANPVRVTFASVDHLATLTPESQQLSVIAAGAAVDAGFSFEVDE